MRLDILRKWRYEARAGRAELTGPTTAISPNPITLTPGIKRPAVDDGDDGDGDGDDIPVNGKKRKTV